MNEKETKERQRKGELEDEWRKVKKDVRVRNGVAKIV